VSQQAQKRRLGEAANQRRPTAADTEEKPPQISPEGKLLLIPIGEGGRGNWGDHFAPSIGGEGHRRGPDWPSDSGGDLGFARELEEERGESEGGLGWVG
jgi:hypothetical protein